MLRKLLSKFFYAFLTLLGVVSLVFFLFNVLPGDPAQMMLGQNESSEQLELVNKKYGFDLPVSRQYILYINDLSPLSLHSTNDGDLSYFSEEKYSAFPLIQNKRYVLTLKWPYLRTSYQKRGKKVSTVIAETFSNTFVLAVSSILIAIILGVVLGIVATLLHNTWADRWLQFVSTIGMSVPSFFSAILFSWFFGFLYHRYTGLEMSGSLYEMDDFGEGRVLKIKNLILPSVVLGIRPIAVIIQLMRSSLLEVLSQDYIKTAYSKGLSTYKVIYKHGIKNALNPVVTIISSWFASLLAGAVFVEYIFGWKGMGKEIVTALNTLDIPVITGIVLTLSSLFILINLLVDFIYTKLDPQVKLK
ncbi:MAG: ABC transporter permease [Flavobacteriaceae bacterium]